MLNRRTLLGALPAAALMRAGPAGAQGAFPERPVRYIVPFPPAGITDMMARLLGQKLSDAWGKPVVVENKPGGSALIGADAAAKSPADGHTLLAVTMTHSVNASLFPSAPYDFRRDFAALSVLGSLPLVVCVNAASPARTLGDLVEMARSRGVNGGSSGNGSPPHLALEVFRRATQAGDKVVHVPYRGGAPSVTDLAAGNIDLLISNLPECLPQVTGGRLRALAVTGPERHRLLPSVPTTKEAGLPALTVTNWTAVMTNSGVPASIKAKIAQDTVVAMRDADLRRRAEEAGFDVLGWDAERSGAFIREETERWAKVVAEAGIKVE